MAQNITLLNTQYSDVGAVTLPKTGGGTALFADASPTTAVESDVASGKIFVKADGSLGTGTASGGGGYTVNDLAVRNYTESDITLTVTLVKQYAFAGANISGSVTAPNATVVETSAFQDTGITRAHFPSVNQRLRSFAFANTEITEITADDFPNVPYMDASAFQGCRQLTSAVMPGFNGSNGNNGFNACGNLEIVDLGSLASTGNSMFWACTKLKTIILRRTSAITAMAHSNVLSNTPFADGGTGGTIYAPSALIASYKTASNWSTYEGYGTITWAAIEDSYYETHYADGTLIT